MKCRALTALLLGFAVFLGCGRAAPPPPGAAPSPVRSSRR